MSALDTDDRNKRLRDASDAQARLSKLEAELEIARLRRLERRRRAAVKGTQRWRREQKEKQKALAARQREQGHLFSQAVLKCPECVEHLRRHLDDKSISMEALLRSVVEPSIKARAN